MLETTPTVAIRRLGTARRGVVVPFPHPYPKPSLSSISSLFSTPCATTLMAFMAGVLVLKEWEASVIALLAFAVVSAARLRTESVWLERLSTMVGGSFYCVAGYLLWMQASSLDSQVFTGFLAGTLLVFLSFSAWVSSLVLEGSSAWVSRVITGVSLAAAVVILGGRGIATG
jgi:hypothetical protein